MSGESFLERWSRLKKVAEQAPAGELPDFENLLKNLGPDSDFGVFLREEVSETIRRQAMKKLFADPRFNVMDRLDTYIDDYSISDPIPPEMLAGLRHMQEAVTQEERDAEAARAAAETAVPAPSEGAVAPVATLGECDFLAADDGQIDPAPVPENASPSANQ
jgi:hypothetical protein